MSQTNIVRLFPEDIADGQGAPGAGLLPLERKKKQFREAEEAHARARELARRDRRYYDNFDDGQWDGHEKQVLRQRNQPIPTNNQVRRKVNFMLGFEQRGRSDPKAYPRRPDQETAADIATDVLKFIDDNTNFDDIASECAKDLGIEGVAAVEIGFDPETEEITADHIQYDQFFYDPRSLKSDFSDARYMGYSSWVDKDVAHARYPDRAEIIDNTTSLDGALFDEGYEDKPYGFYTTDNRQRIRVIVHHYRAPTGEWIVCHWTGGGELYEEVSPWRDEHGRPVAGLKAQSLYVTHDGERMGFVRDMVSPQDEINLRIARSLALMNDRRTWGVSGWTHDENAAKEAMARADGHVEVSGPLGQNWGLLDSTAEIAGNFELLREAKEAIAAQGPNASLQGRGVETQSGRAIEAQQNAGLTEENYFFDRHRAFKLSVYRLFWSIARHNWRAPRWIRVSGDRRSAQFTAVNQPVTDPFGRVVQMQNPISQIDVDIILDVGPDVLTLQSEQFDTLANIIPALVNAPPAFALMLLEASSLRHKERAIAALEQTIGAQQGAPDPLQLAGAQAELEGRAADIRKKDAETEKIRVETARAFADADAGPEPPPRRQHY